MSAPSVSEDPPAEDAGVPPQAVAEASDAEPSVGAAAEEPSTAIEPAVVESPAAGSGEATPVEPEPADSAQMPAEEVTAEPTAPATGTPEPAAEEGPAAEVAKQPACDSAGTADTEHGVAGDDRWRQRLARDHRLEPEQVAAIEAMLAAGALPPFIAKHRRDRAGGATEPELAAIHEALRTRDALQSRKAAITRSLEAQHKLSDTLKREIDRAESLHRLEDLYLPFKPSQPGPASEARDLGLEPLADEIHRELQSTYNLDARASEFVDIDKKVADAASAIAGAGRILAERFSHHSELRRRVRSIVRKTGKLVCKRTVSTPGKKAPSDKKAEPYKAFFDYREPLSKPPPHRVLAINRGERAGVLSVAVEADTDAALKIASELLAPETHVHVEMLRGCADEAVRGLLLPALTAEARADLNERADKHALEVFARNLRNLLLGPRVVGRRVLAIDPGYQNGCHVAALDESGGVLATDKVMIVGEGQAEGRARLIAMVNEHKPGLIAVGNGKACRPVEELLSSLLAEELKDAEAEYLVVTEAGANVYAGGPIGREELPQLDAPFRSAVSIGRRVQDPLAELVKVDPASVGVGLYQHDAKGKPMQDALEDVVRSCVAHVGVDLNSAPTSLLRYVPGLNQFTARRIVEHRTKEGPLKSRQALSELPGLPEAAWKQAAGFVKVTGGDEPLDATWVHPDHYPAARKLLEATGVSLGQLLGEGGGQAFAAAVADRNRDELATLTELGKGQLRQVIAALSKPGADPRDDLPPPISRRGLVRLEDLQAGTELQGSVLNVVDFGAFVDIGLTDSGLLHISRMSSGYVNDPHAIVAVGDRIRVWVDSVDADRKRVSLTMIDPSAPKPEPGARHGNRPRRGKPNRQQSGEGQAPAAEGAGQSQAASGRQQGNRQQSGGKPGGRQQGDRQQRGKGGNRRRDRQQGKRTTARSEPRVYEAQAKGPPKPITQEMEEGKEALRTFGDLMQLFEKRKDGDKKEEEE
ncbi:MAG: Tex-like N-terminal domain-containing protein [Planctomycetota bacterium]